MEQAEMLARQLKRIGDLYKQKAIPYGEVDKAETDVLLATMELREAKENSEMAKLEKDRAEHILSRRTINSPVNGVVVKTLVDPGETVEGTPVMTIAEVNPLNVEVILPADRFGSVKVGTEASITPIIRGARAKKAKVIIVDRVIDAASNTFGIRLELSNPDYAIPGGIRCDIDFLN